MNDRKACSKMRQYGLVTVLLILSSTVLPAQSDQIGTWNILNIKYTHSENLSLFGEGQLRSLDFYTNFHYYELKGGINYRVHKSVKLTLGAGTYQTFKEGGNFVLPKNNDEFRLWPQIILSQDVNRLRIEQRYRIEMRWTNAGYRNRFRYRLGVSHPLGKTSKGYQPFQVNLSNEIFFTDNEPYFERNRALMTLDYKTSMNLTLQLGYLYQFDYKINDETGKNFLVVGLYYELFGNRSEAKHVHEHKDN